MLSLIFPHDLIPCSLSHTGGRPVMIRGLPKFVEEIMTRYGIDCSMTKFTWAHVFFCFRCWEETPEDRPTAAVLKKKLDTLCEVHQWFLV